MKYWCRCSARVKRELSPRRWGAFQVTDRSGPSRESHVKAVSYHEEGDGRRHQNFLGHFFGPGDRLDDLVSVAAGTSANGPRRCWLRRMILLASRCRES